ncbi:MAG: hypothetical protein N2C14_17735, partial [Planctomycetales bacterium]
MSQKHLTVEEAASLLGVGLAEIINLFKTGAIQADDEDGGKLSRSDLETVARELGVPVPEVLDVDEDADVMEDVVVDLGAIVGAGEDADAGEDEDAGEVSDVRNLEYADKEPSASSTLLAAEFADSSDSPSEVRTRVGDFEQVAPVEINFFRNELVGGDDESESQAAANDENADGESNADDNDDETVADEDVADADGPGVSLASGVQDVISRAEADAMEVKSVSMGNSGIFSDEFNSSDSAEMQTVVGRAPALED